MKRDNFMMHLMEGCACVVVREDKSGYTVVRNPDNNRISGVPKGEDIRPMTICKICTHLQITVPEIVKHFQPFIDLIDKSQKED